jgi:NADPH:quinone reductase-like Zn-dependent oxidoreductase
MKAIVYKEYGSTDNLNLEEIEKPTPGDNEVLIKVHATSVNASDYEFVKGEPLYTRMWGLRKPGNQILGSDIAGTIEATGSSVSEFKTGDEVFGDILGNWGGFAEYVAAPEKKLVLKPGSMTFEEVAAFPQAAVVALQGIRDKGKVQPGQKVLINGAGGGGGTFAVQLAKFYGAEVTGVDHGEKLGLLQSLGADNVIDYTREDYTRNISTYDYILDLVAHRSIFDCKRALAPHGRYALVGGSMSALFQTLTIGSFLSLIGSKKMGMLAVNSTAKDLSYMIELFEAGKIKPVIDKQYSLSDVPEALRYVGEGHARGKVIITM